MRLTVTAEKNADPPIVKARNLLRGASVTKPDNSLHDDAWWKIEGDRCIGDMTVCMVTTS
jgi:hypothetical protein